MKRLRRLAPKLAAVGVGIALLFSPALAAGAKWWHPTVGISWYWQLQGTIHNNVEASVYDLDGFDTSAREVAKLHNLGHHVVCYVDVGTWEKWRSDAKAFPKSVIGNDNGWPGERWLDVRQLSVLEPIMTKRFAMCAAKGFDAVEPDNIDSQGNNPGFPITAAQQLRYIRWVAREVHSLGMAVLQKNDPSQTRALVSDMDGALVEQCNQYAECSAFSPYISAGKPVLDAEYRAKLYPGFCSNDTRLHFDGVLYDLALDGRLFKPCR